MRKPTFKKIESTGRFASFSKPQVDIKIKGKCVGSIIFSHKHNEMRIQLHVKKERTQEDPAPFSNVTLKKSTTGVSERVQVDCLKEWLRTPKIWAQIEETLDLYHMD